MLQALGMLGKEFVLLTIFAIRFDLHLYFGIKVDRLANR